MCHQFLSFFFGRWRAGDWIGMGWDVGGVGGLSRTKAKRKDCRFSTEPFRNDRKERGERKERKGKEEKRGGEGAGQTPFPPQCESSCKPNKTFPHSSSFLSSLPSLFHAAVRKKAVQTKRILNILPFYFSISFLSLLCCPSLLTRCQSSKREKGKQSFPRRAVWPFICCALR